MQVHTGIDSRRIHDAESCRDWLDGLRATTHDRLEEFAELLADLGLSSLEPERVLAIVEQLRPAHLAELCAVFDRCDPDVFPMKAAERRACARALAGLAQGRELYKSLHERLRSPDDPPTEIDTRTFSQAGDAAATITAAPRAKSAVKGAAKAGRGSPRTITAPPTSAAVPLGRAIDYQARMLVAMQRLKLAIAHAEWDEICLLARRMRAASLLDVPLLRAPTARALFVYPLLIWLSHPNSRGAAQAALIERLARRWAGRVGFRLEQGAILHDTRNGPSIELTEHHTVRLVSHRLVPRIASRLAELEAMGTRTTSRLPRGLTLATTRLTLEQLRESWCEPRARYLVPDVKLGVMRLRFGFPAGAHQGERAGTGRGRANLHVPVSRGYIYGRFESNTLTRVSSTDPLADPLAPWIEAAEPADWVSIERHQSVFEGSFATGGVALGAIVMIVPVASAPLERTEGNASDARHRARPGFMLGRVVALEQRQRTDPEAPMRHRVSVAVWSGRPLLVGVRVSDGSYQDAFLIAPDASLGEPESLLVRARCVRAGERATLRDGMRDCGLRVDEVLELGPGYERVRITRSAH
ncbi:MAG: hypothetical protein KJZ83_13860 [Burkholderiaceae bacterium]|nr:hypothetical protein [Burkholderiaceae bacterium]